MAELIGALFLAYLVLTIAGRLPGLALAALLLLALPWLFPLAMVLAIAFTGSPK